MKTIQEIMIIEKYRNKSLLCEKRGLHTQEGQYNLDMNDTHRPRSNCQVPTLPDNVNYTQKFALANLIQHGIRSRAECLLIKIKISTAKIRQERQDREGKIKHIGLPVLYIFR